MNIAPTSSEPFSSCDQVESSNEKPAMSNESLSSCPAEPLSSCSQVESSDDQSESESDESDKKEASPSIYMITAEMLSGFYFDFIAADYTTNYYATTDWSPKFYCKMSYQGFIAVSHAKYLLPEMQRTYSLISLSDAKNPKFKLHISKKTRSRAKNYLLSLDCDLEGVVAGIRGHHQNSWVSKEYEELWKILMANKDGWEIAGAKTKFRAHTVELLGTAPDGALVLVAGEMGFSIGQAYTSLTGFWRKDLVGSDQKLLYNGAGKVQLAALGALLRHRGFVLWGLGHPFKPEEADVQRSMMYKKEIGAGVVDRAEYLRHWSHARDEELAIPLSKTDHPLNAKNVIDSLRQSKVSNDSSE